MPSSRGSSRPRDLTRVSFVSCTDRQVLYTSATWEALSKLGDRRGQRSLACCSPLGYIESDET